MRWALLVVLGLAFVGLVAELVARAWLRFFGRYYVWPPGARLEMTTDREAVPELEPVIRVEFNADGERGGPLPADWKDTMRILVAGGSVAECWYLDQASTWPQVIERRLNEPANLARLGVSRVYVGNVARSLLTCDHIGRIFDKILPRYERLDAILLMVGASDLVHWLEMGTPQVIDAYDLPLDSLFGQNPEGPFIGIRYFAIWRVAAAVRRRILRPVVRHDNGGRRIARARQARSRAKTFLRQVPDPAPMLDRFETSLRALIEKSRAKARRVVLVRQPWLERAFTQEDEKKLWMFWAGSMRHEATSTYYALEVVWDLMRKVDERVVHVAKDLGIETIDLRPVVPPSFELWYDEMHHNARGCERIGEAVAERLLAQAQPPVGRA